MTEKALIQEGKALEQELKALHKKLKAEAEVEQEFEYNIQYALD